MTTEALLAQVDGFLARKEDRSLKSLLLRSNAQDIAQVIDQLQHGKRKVFALLPPEVQAAVAVLLPEGDAEYVFRRLPEHVTARFLHFNDEDDATDILQQLPEAQRQKVLRHIPENKRKKIEKLLMFGEETAGGLMDLNFLSVHSTDTIQGVRATVQEYSHSQKQIPVVIVTEESRESHGKILGILSPRDLLLSAGSHKAGPAAKSTLVFSHTTDREQVLSRMVRSGSDIACVLGDLGQVLGVIHIRDLLRVAEAEATEDAYRMGAVTPIETDYLSTPFLQVWRNRVMWLSVLFVAELFTFTALAAYEESLAAVTVLALFLPLCISTGGNSGSQAATLITRAMALGEVGPRDWWRVLRHELLMGILLGAALGVIGFSRAFLTPGSILGTVDRWALALTIGQSVAVICLWGTLVGSLLPLLFKKLGVDPAYASSPFVATFVDVTGIILYFSIAKELIM